MNQFLATLTPKKVLNLLKNRVSFALALVTKRGRVAGAPVSLSVEPAAVCQLHCPECVMGSGRLVRKNRYLDFEIFKSVIDQNADTLCYLMLYFQGEPFLAPKIFEIICYANKRGIYTATSTNAQNIDQDMAEKIVLSGLKRLIISLDGTTQKSYERYRRGGKLQNVIDAIKFINQAKQKLSINTPEIELQFVVFSHNENEIDDFLRLKHQLNVQKCSVKTAQIYNFEEKSELIPQNQKFSRYVYKNGVWQLKHAQHNFCLRQWQGAVVTSDGDVVPCCFDKNADHRFGNLHDSDFKTIWQGRVANHFRQQILMNRHNIDICQNCTE